MQTFLPYPCFLTSAEVLDYKRLGKQRVEGKQIIEILEGKKSPWENHPAVLMWNGHIDCLKIYVNIMIREWKHRGYKNTIPYYEVDYNKAKSPPWRGNKLFHLSHKMNLLRKDFDHYSKYFEYEVKTFPKSQINSWCYYWPTKEK